MGAKPQKAEQGTCGKGIELARQGGEQAHRAGRRVAKGLPV